MAKVFTVFAVAKSWPNPLFPFPSPFTSHYWTGHSFFFQRPPHLWFKRDSNNHLSHCSVELIMWSTKNAQLWQVTKAGLHCPSFIINVITWRTRSTIESLWHESLCRATTAKFQHKLCLTPWTDLDLGEDGCQRGLLYLVSVITAALRIIIYWPQFWSLFSLFLLFRSVINLVNEVERAAGYSTTSK